MQQIREPGQCYHPAPSEILMLNTRGWNWVLVLIAIVVLKCAEIDWHDGNVGTHLYFYRCSVEFLMTWWWWCSVVGKIGILVPLLTIHRVMKRKSVYLVCTAKLQPHCAQQGQKWKEGGMGCTAWLVAM